MYTGNLFFKTAFKVYSQRSILYTFFPVIYIFLNFCIEQMIINLKLYKDTELSEEKALQFLFMTKENKIFRSVLKDNVR